MQPLTCRNKSPLAWSSCAGRQNGTRACWHDRSPTLGEMGFLFFEILLDRVCNPSNEYKPEDFDLPFPPALARQAPVGARTWRNAHQLFAPSHTLNAFMKATSNG